MLRRKFLQLSGLGALMVAAPGAGFASISMRDAAVGAIINEFDYLVLDRKGVEDFVDDFLPYYYWTGQLKHSLVIRTLYVMKLNSESAVNVFKTTLLRTLAETYLLSTDFFANNMDETKTVRYTGLYSPYNKPCANPFSYIYYPDQVS